MQTTLSRLEERSQEGIRAITAHSQFGWTGLVQASPNPGRFPFCLELRKEALDQSVKWRPNRHSSVGPGTGSLEIEVTWIGAHFEFAEGY